MTFDLFTELPFGKHKDEMMGTVIEDDPEYVEWLLRETEHRLSDAALEYLKDCK